ncbi:MAG: ABC transporter ATP-binding protein [Lachnospiraceae bacterium]|nr:ABC transporter ATP-binding protein [Lachnospiraceae bacterium]
MKREKTRIGYAIQLSQYIKGFRLYLLGAILCNMAFKVLPLLMGLVTSYLVSSVLLGETSHVVSLLITAGVLVILTSVFSYLDVQVSHDMAYRILTQLRDKCYDKLDVLAPAVTAGQRSGDMISIILGDVETLEWFYAHTIGQLVVAFVVPAAALVFMGIISWYLPITIIPFIVLLVLVPRRSANEANAQGTAVKTTTGILNSIIIDGVQGIKDIISFRWQQEYFKRFFSANNEYSDASIAYAKRRGNESRGISLIMESAALVVDVVTILLVAAGKISVLWLMPIFILSSAIFSPIQDALAMSTNYGLIFGAAKRVIDLFEMEPMVKDAGKEFFRVNDEVEITFDNVKFTYPEISGNQDNSPVLKGLSFSFHTGETVAFVGASGSGKTTAARLLQRFWDVNDGAISINGKDIRELSLDSLRNTITVVPQDVYLFNITVKENLRLAKLSATEEEIQNAASEACADDFIRKLPYGFDTPIGERGLRLSGGEKQRLSIAQAFLKNSPVLVLDEASANLDAENERLINQAVSRLKKGRATLVIAHRISTIRSVDRIVVLKDGKALAEGTYGDLAENCPDFRRLIGDEYGGKSNEE